MTPDQAIWDRLLMECWKRNRLVIILIKLYMLEAHGIASPRGHLVDLDAFLGLGLKRAPIGSDIRKNTRPMIAQHCPQMSACLFDLGPDKVLPVIDRFTWGVRLPQRRRSHAHYSKDEYNAHHGADLNIRFRERDKSSDWKTVK